MRALIGLLLCDESGQDLIEYALLTAGIGIAGIAFWPAFETTIRLSYENLDRDAQNLWIPPDPAGGGS